LRSDGTAVYMTQDIGTAIQRVKDFPRLAEWFTVGNEQDYHFKVLFLILKKLVLIGLKAYIIYHTEW
jgi:arginyl-tRNA synthetase